MKRLDFGQPTSDQDWEYVYRALQEIRERSFVDDTTDQGLSALQAEVDTAQTDIDALEAVDVTLDTRLDALEDSVYFHVTRNSDDSGKTGGIYNKINFSTEVVDSDSFFDSATNFRFTPTKAGWYFIAMGAKAANDSAADEPAAAIYKNGSIAFAGTYGRSGAAGFAWSNAHGLVQLNGSTDYVEGWIYLPTGVTVVKGGATDTFMFGYRVAT